LETKGTSNTGMGFQERAKIKGYSSAYETRRISNERLPEMKLKYVIIIKEKVFNFVIYYEKLPFRINFVSYSPEDDSSDIDADKIL
jgi:hypothetical protein